MTGAKWKSVRSTNGRTGGRAAGATSIRLIGFRRCLARGTRIIRRAPTCGEGSSSRSPTLEKRFPSQGGGWIGAVGSDDCHGAVYVDCGDGFVFVEQLG